MRLHVAFRYNDYCGGMEKHVASAVSTNKSKSVILSNKDKVPRTYSRSNYLSEWQKTKKSRIGKMKDYLLLNAVLLFYVCRNPKISRIFIHGDFYVVLVLPFCVFYPALKIYLVSHDRLDISFIRKSLFKLLGRFIEVHITTSGYNYVTYKNYFRRSYFRPTGAKKNTVITKKVIQHDQLDMIVVANDYRKKNINQYINLIRKCLNLNLKLEFHHIGYLQPDRMEQLLQLGCKVHGFLDGEQVLKKLNDCDILFCPSHIEGTPKVFFEALSRGVCVYIHSSILFNQNELFFGMNKLEFSKIGVFTYDSYDELSAEGIKEIIKKIQYYNAFSEVNRLRRMQFANVFCEDILGQFYDDIY